MAEPLWHSIRPLDACAHLGTDPQRGLTPAEAERRLRKYGPNRIGDGKSLPPWVYFFKQFKDFLVLVLIGAAGISAALGELYDAAAILLIVVLNATMGFVQEFRAERSLQMLKRLSAPKATVVRSGRPVQIASEQLVPGDIIVLESGSRVPADGRLLQSTGLETDESPLTGESAPVWKDEGWLGAPDVELAERRNMVYAGTTVTRGWARALVVATGMGTEMGRIAHLLEESDQGDTPLQVRLAQVGRYLVLVCLAIVAIVFLTGLWSGVPLYRMFLTAVSLAVAAIPEGLPAAVTVALALGVQRMARRRAIVRRLPAVETLGCATVICSDKTGTLTRNEMTVTSVWMADAGGTVQVEGDGYRPVGRFLTGGKEVKPRPGDLLYSVLAAGTVCSHGQLVEERSRWGQRQWAAFGDPTEVALVVAAQKAGISRADVEDRWPVASEMPFDSERRMMSVLCAGDLTPGDGDRGNGARWTVVTKGAPDAVLDRCTHLATPTGTRPLTPADRHAILARNDAMASQGLRVLAVAWRPVSAGPIRLSSSRSSSQEGRRTFDPGWESELVFGGLVGMHDPPRPEAKAAIEAARTAGIRTIVLTGDHPATAGYIARSLGLIAEGDRVLTGKAIDRLDDRQVLQTLKEVRVFARVSPAHKLRIVRVLKAHGEIIAMTGDGVNDAPAIKEAHIGIAMGRTGSDVTREASDMVLADDNFATIVAAIEEGRGIYANVRKFIRYLLTCNTGEILTMFLAALGGFPLPLLPMQILWMNIVTDGLPAIALGVEKTEPGTMERPPRRPDESLFAGGLHWRILYRGLLIGLTGLAAFLLALVWMGSTVDDARTIAFSALVFAQLVFAFDCRSETTPWTRLGFFSNPFLVVAVLVSAAMQLVVIYWPPLQTIFGTTPLASEAWVLIAGVVCAGSLLDRTFKAARRRSKLHSSRAVG